MESKEILRVLGSFAEFYENLQSLIEIYRAYIQSRFQKSWGYSHGGMSSGFLQGNKEDAKMHIVLHEPEIPGNTGNIGRSCAATNTSLQLMEPLGVDIPERELRSAGLGCWCQLDVHRYRDYEDFLLEQFGSSSYRSGRSDGERRPPRIWFATTKARKLYSEADFGPDDYIMFGKESAGIPEEILVDNEETCIRIPMGYGIRSLNLSNAVAVVLYEALRRNGFPGLEREGELHRLHWKE